LAGRKATKKREPSHVLNEVEAIVLLAVGSVLALSFASYSDNSPDGNYVGPVGHWLSDKLVQCFGYAAYLIPIVLVTGAIALFVKRERFASPFRLIGALTIQLEAAVLLGLYRPEHAPEAAGGWLGGFIAVLMRESLGLVGSSVILAALGALTWLMLTGTPLGVVVQRVGAGLPGLLETIVERVGGFIRTSASNVWQGMRDRIPQRARENTQIALAEPEVDTPIVFGSDIEEAVVPEIEELPVRAEPVVEITKRELPSRAASKKSKSDEEIEQEEFRFALDDNKFKLPPIKLLGGHDDTTDYSDNKTLLAQSKILEQKLGTFGVSGRCVAVRPGPVITTYEFEPDAGIKVSRVVNLSDDLTMALRAHGVRIVAPIPGKNVVGIEVSNRNRAMVGLRDLIENEEFLGTGAPLPLALGRDTTGLPVYADLGKMPHLLMAGATGAGKSVSLNTIILSLLYSCTPRECRFIMIDPKMLELSLYEGIPHLLIPVVTDVKKASAALTNVMREMDRRFELMKELQVRNLDDYNETVAGMDEEEPEEEEEEEWEEEEVEASADDSDEEEEGEEEEEEEEEWEEEEDEEDEAEEETGLRHEHLPRVVVIVDELADLMMVVGREIEVSVTRLAQKARAAGIHLIVATQRPSVDVITGLIKANFPCRISFKVTSRPDSRTILDTVGADRLLGNGDMLYLSPGTSFLQRLHGAFVSDKEIREIVSSLKKQGKPEYHMELLDTPASDKPDPDEEEFFDELYDKAVDLVLEHGQGSTSWVQRKLGIGYNRAARMMEHMEREGVVGPADGARPRKVLVGNAATGT
jgi:S-DNA-T family DNA segregation ATPase FtsK/SpoIIIE